MPIVFVTTNTINGRKYLGKCVHKKPCYLGSGVAIKHAIIKYGKNSFTKHIIQEVDTLLEAANLEFRLSVEWNVVNDPLWYNLKIGGVGGSVKGRKFSSMHRQRLSDSHKGKSTWNKGLSGTDLVKHRPETIEKIANSNRGKKRSKETRDRISRSVPHTDYILTDPQGNDILVSNLAKFCREEGLWNSALVNIAKGKKGVHTSKGWKCRYAK